MKDKIREQLPFTKKFHLCKVWLWRLQSTDKCRRPGFAGRSAARIYVYQALLIRFLSLHRRVAQA